MILFPRVGAGSCLSEQEILSPSFCLPKLYCFSYLQPNSLTPVSCPASDVSELAASAYSQPPMQWYIPHPHPFIVPPSHLPTEALRRACWIQAAVKPQPTSQGPLEKPRLGGREKSAVHPPASSFKRSPPAAPGWHPPRSLLGHREPRIASWALLVSAGRVGGWWWSGRSPHRSCPHPCGSSASPGPHTGAGFVQRPPWGSCPGGCCRWPAACRPARGCQFCRSKVGTGRSLAHAGPEPTLVGQPPALPGAPLPVRHAAFLDVRDDQGLPSLPAGRWREGAMKPTFGHLSLAGPRSWA